MPQMYPMGWLMIYFFVFFLVVGLGLVFCNFLFYGNCVKSLCLSEESEWMW